MGMIKDVFDSARTLELAVGRLELQQDVRHPIPTSTFASELNTRDSRFDEWRDIWRDENGEPDMKFEAYAKANPAAGKRVLRQLALMSQALCDAHALEDKYGIKPSHWPDRV